MNEYTVSWDDRYTILVKSSNIIKYETSLSVSSHLYLTHWKTLVTCEYWHINITAAKINIQIIKKTRQHIHDIMKQIMKHNCVRLWLINTSLHRAYPYRAIFKVSEDFLLKTFRQYALILKIMFTNWWSQNYRYKSFSTAANVQFTTYEASSPKSYNITK